MSYYHDELMEKLFEILKQPRSIEELELSEDFVQGLILKIISNFGTVETSTINEITGLHWDILEENIAKMEKYGFCAPVSGGFLFSSVKYSITKKGREKARRLIEENPYIGIAPVSYDNYYQIMEMQLKKRFPIKIPPEVIERTFEDVVGVEYAKECLVESCTIGKGVFIYGSPGTGKTFIVSKMSNLLPPLMIPKFIEFGGRVLELFDPDFHRKCGEQPKDPRWVKIKAPFVITGAELSLNKLETVYDPNRGLYETSPIIKANGGILLIDDLGRQRDDHELILNRLIVPMENKQDMIYVRGIPIIVHAHFIPAFSTNLDISIMDEAHLRRAPLHIFLRNPDIEDVAEVFKRNMDELEEDYTPDVLERFMEIYEKQDNGGEGLEPSFAHARDVAQICQAVRINQQKNQIDIPVLNESLDKHVLIALQRMNIDITQTDKKIRSLKIDTERVDKAQEALQNFGATRICCLDSQVLFDVEESTSPVEVVQYLQDEGIEVKNIDFIVESEKHLSKTILKWNE